jgi:hypothetical protein
MRLRLYACSHAQSVHFVPPSDLSFRSARAAKALNGKFLWYRFLQYWVWNLYKSALIFRLLCKISSNRANQTKKNAGPGPKCAVLKIHVAAQTTCCSDKTGYLSPIKSRSSVKSIEDVDEAPSSFWWIFGYLPKFVCKRKITLHAKLDIKFQKRGRGLVSHVKVCPSRGGRGLRAQSTQYIDWMNESIDCTVLQWNIRQIKVV